MRSSFAQTARRTTPLFAHRGVRTPSHSRRLGLGTRAAAEVGPARSLQHGESGTAATATYTRSAALARESTQTRLSNTSESESAAGKQCCRAADAGVDTAARCRRRAAAVGDTEQTATAKTQLSNADGFKDNTTGDCANETKRTATAITESWSHTQRQWWRK